MSQQKLTERVDFGIIRYANCWEDADILLKGLSPKYGSKILSIGSAGDNSFSLLTTQPELVVAVDINQIQLFLIELKKACIIHLEREETMAFLGFTFSNDREKYFHLLKKELGREARSYWEANLPLIRNGIIHQGKFEKYFQLFSRKILPWIHNKQTINALFDIKTTQQQNEFYSKKWNTWRWKLLFRIFFSNYVMGKYGRDPEFLKQVEGSVSKFIFNKADQHLRSEVAQTNYILRYTLTGNFDKLLPHYLQAENYDLVRANMERLRMKAGFAQEAISEYGKFSYMNLSDIFEYMAPDLFKKTAQALVNATEKNGKLAYWNLMVPRRISHILPDEAVYCQEESERLTAVDKGFFYKAFVVDQKLN